MLLDKILFYVIIGSFEFSFLFAVTVFYRNSKQNREHEKELLKMELERESKKESIEENDQYITILNLLKDYDFKL